MTSTTDKTDIVPPVDVPGEVKRGNRKVLLRVAVHAAWIIALAVAVVARIGRFGFNPSDPGFVVSLSWRLLEGSIPHVDLISPRPLGSAVLHLIDFAIPAPLFVSSAFVTMVEIILSTVACIALITRTSPLDWGPLRTCLVAAASLVSLHTFMLMAWHTVDGIFLSAMGWWLLDIGLRNKSAWPRRIGLFLLGFAVMTKQSFMFAVPAGVLLLLFHPAVNLRGNLRSARWWRQTIVDLLCLGAFPLIYVAVVTAAGGLKPMIEQLTGGAGAWGANLYDFWGNPFVTGDIRRHILMVAACVVLAAAAWFLRNRLGKTAPWIRLLPLAAAAAVTIYALIQTELAFPATWATKLLWVFIAAIVLDALVHKHFPWRPLLVVLLAYMASLSWGYAYPGLMAGVLVLGTLELLTRAVPEIKLSRAWLIPQAAVGLVALVLTGMMAINAHDKAPAIDQPQGQLTADLGAATPKMRWIRTTPDVAAYVGQIGECTRRYPASKVAVLPDNPFAYAAFDLHNPFPIDWPLPMELVGDGPQRMLDTVARLNREGDYLVLFQTISRSGLHSGLHVPATIAPDTPVVLSSGLEEQIRSGLTGQKLTCGSFQAVWAPRG